MDQQYPTTLPIPPSPSKGWTGKETLTVIFLILLPIVGLILLWTIANWSKKAKAIITVVLLLPIIAAIGILSSTVLVSMGGARETARDAIRKVDMRQIVTAEEIYFGINDQYYQSVSYPTNIPGVMFQIPTDPTSKGPYGWINNVGNSQKFCAYADLEKGGFYIASQKGNGEISTKPATLLDCEKIY